MSDLAIEVNELDFAYAALNAPSRPVLSGVTLNLPRGSRCLLVGANGAGAFSASERRSELLCASLAFS